MENEPLVGGRTTSSHVLEQDDSNGCPAESNSIRPFFLCIFALEFCIKFAATLLELPILRLVELMVCRRRADINPNDADEMMCKTAAVQNKVAFIIGCRTMLDALPCLLTVVFYGHFSNSWGRKFVIMLQISGRLLALSWMVLVGFFSDSAAPELIWISSLFLFLGGGRKAEVSIIYTSFCDVVPEEKRVRLLALAHSSESLAGILSYPIGSMLMAYRLWIPFSLALGMNVFEYIVLWCTPETSPFVNTKAGVYRFRYSTQHDQNLLRNHWGEISTAQIQRSTFRTLFEHRGLNIIFAGFFIKRIAFSSEDFVPQYVSETLHRRISQTFWLQACNHLGMLLALSVLIPFLTRHLKSLVKNLSVIYASLVSVMVGFFILWRGKNILTLCLGLITCGLGEGLDVGLQSLGSYIVPEAHRGAFFALSSMLGVAGELLGGPLMAAVYAVRDDGGKPLGYCFLLSVFLFTCLLLGIGFINTSRLRE